MIAWGNNKEVDTVRMLDKKLVDHFGEDIEEAYTKVRAVVNKESKKNYKVGSRTFQNFATQKHRGYEDGWAR